MFQTIEVVQEGECPRPDGCDFYDLGFCKAYGYPNCPFNSDGTEKETSVILLENISPVLMRNCYAPRCTYCKWQETCPPWLNSLVEDQYGEICEDFLRILPFSEDHPPSED